MNAVSLPRDVASPPALTLRPRSVADLFDETIRLYRRHWGAMVGIAAAAQVPWTILSTALPAFFMPGVPPYGVGLLAGSLLPQFHLLLVRPLMLAAVGVYLAELAQGGRVGPWRAYGRVLRRIVPMGAATCLVTVVIAAFGAMLVFGAAVPGTFNPAPMSGLGIALNAIWLICLLSLAFGLAIFCYARWLLTPLAIAVERAGLRRAFRRSWDLTRRRLGYVIMVWILLEALRLLLAAIPTLVAQAVLAALLGSPTGSVWLAWLPSLVELPFDVLILPIPLVGLALLYLDLRARFEGLDLALASRSPTPMEAPQPAGNLLRAADLRQVGLVILVILLVVGATCGSLYALPAIFSNL
jgi:hypothetical protein